MFDNDYLEEDFIENRTEYDGGSDDCDFDIDDDPNSKAEWFVIHTYSGHEKKVKSSIEKIVESKDMQDQILKVNVPTQKIITIKTVHSKKNEKGSSKKSKKEETKEEVRHRIIFPGYVFVKMIHNDQTWFLVRNTRGVTGFVGAGTKPTPLTRAEMEDMHLVRRAIVSDFEPGETVQVVEGYLQNNYGVVEEVYPERQMVKVLISALNASIELPFGMVTKIKK